jgi:adenylate cyclase
MMNFARKAILFFYLLLAFAGVVLSSGAKSYVLPLHNTLSQQNVELSVLPSGNFLAFSPTCSFFIKGQKFENVMQMDLSGAYNTPSLQPCFLGKGLYTVEQTLNGDSIIPLPLKWPLNKYITHAVAYGRYWLIVSSDSLWLVGANTCLYVNSAISGVYKIGNQYYFWSKKAGLICGMGKSAKLLSRNSLMQTEAPARIVATPKGILVIFRKPFAAYLLSKKKSVQRVVLQRELCFSSGSFFQHKYFIALNNGSLWIVSASKDGAISLRPVKDQKEKVLGVGSSIRGDLVFLFKNRMEFISTVDQLIEQNSTLIDTTLRIENGKAFLLKNNKLELSYQSGYSTSLKVPEAEIFMLIPNNGVVTIVTSKGLINSNNHNLLIANDLISSRARSSGQSFWIFYNDSLRRVHVDNENFTVEHSLPFSSRPQRIETDRDGNLWTITSSGLYFYSPQTNQSKKVLSGSFAGDINIYPFGDKLIIYNKSKFYLCSFSGDLMPLRFTGEVSILPDFGVTDLKPFINNSGFVTFCFFNGTQYCYTLSKIELNDNTLHSIFLTSFKNSAPIRDIEYSLFYVEIISGGKSFKIWYPRNITERHINFFSFGEGKVFKEVVLKKTTNKMPGNIAFRITGTETNGYYQTMLEPTDSDWSACSTNAYRTLPKLKTGVHKLHVRWCNQNGHVEAQSTLVLWVDRSQWLSSYWVLIYIISFIIIGLIFFRFLYWWRIRQKIKLEHIIEERTAGLREEKEKIELLLADFVPRDASEEIISTGRSTYQRYDNVTVMFSDIQGFTQIAESTDPEMLIRQLDDFFFCFDSIVARYGVEKIKTIGDAYMCAGGLPLEKNTSPVEMILVAIEFQQAVSRLAEKGGLNWQVRIGIHTGPVVAGVIGQRKLSYDIWGDTVNVANRMESSADPGRINISGTTWALVKNFFDCEYRGKIPMKNKNDADMYFVNGIHFKLQENGKPNELFDLNMQLLRLNDLSEIVFRKIQNHISSSLYFHTQERMHEVFSRAFETARLMSLEVGQQLVLGTASLLLYYGMTEDYLNFLEHSKAYAWSLLREYFYTTEQIEAVCKTMDIFNSLNPNNIEEELLLESVFYFLGQCGLEEQLRALYIEESEMLGRAAWNEWAVKKIEHYRHVLSVIDTTRANFMVNPETQFRKIVDLKN